VTVIIRAIRAIPGKLRSITHSRLLVNTYAYSVSARSSRACSAAALSPPDGPVTMASMPRVEASVTGKVPQLRVRGGVIGGSRRPVLRPVRGRVRHPGQGPVDRPEPQVADLDGPVVVLLVLGAGGGQDLVPQPQQRLRAGRVPPRDEHRVRRHAGRRVPGQQRQVPEQRGQDLPVAGLRHQARQQHRPHRRRHRHRPPRRALHLPARHRLRRDQVDDAGLPGHLVQLLPDDPEPGVVSGVPAGLHPPVAADHRRRDRDRLQEDHQVPGADRPPPRPPSARSGPLPQRTAQRAGQVSDPDRDDPRPRQLRRPPARHGRTGGKRHSRIERHEGLQGPEGRQ
jgi:hypothetical protein